MKVAVFEDEPRWVEMLTQDIEDSGHKVAGIATTLPEALGLISTLEELQAALVDGNLDPSKHDGEDGKTILEELRKKFGAEVYTICISAANELPGSDLHLSKSDKLTDPRNLADALIKLSSES